MATILRADREIASRPAKAAGSIEDAGLAAYARGGPIAGGLSVPEREAPGVEIGSFSLPAHAGGCEVHDVFRVSADTLALVIADTWCVGASRDALSDFIRSMVRDLCSISRSPEEVLARLGWRRSSSPCSWAGSTCARGVCTTPTPATRIPSG